jgi:hypothetical protein
MKINSESNFVRLLASLKSESHFNRLIQLMHDGKVPTTSLVNTINLCILHESPSFSSVKLLFKWCSKLDEDDENSLSDIVRQQCWLILGALTSRLNKVEENKNGDVRKLTEDIFKVLNFNLNFKISFQQMVSTYSSTKSEHQKIHALRVIGNMGALESISFVRRVIFERFDANPAQKHQVDRITLLHKLIVIDGLRNVKSQYSEPELITISLDCLKEKADPPIIVACSSLFFEMSPSIVQIDEFKTQIIRHDSYKEIKRLFKLKWELALNMDDDEEKDMASKKYVFWAISIYDAFY